MAVHAEVLHLSRVGLFVLLSLRHSPRSLVFWIEQYPSEWTCVRISSSSHLSFVSSFFLVVKRFLPQLPYLLSTTRAPGELQIKWRDTAPS